jgi:hypothetical protein
MPLVRTARFIVTVGALSAGFAAAAPPAEGQGPKAACDGLTGAPRDACLTRMRADGRLPPDRSTGETPGPTFPPLPKPQTPPVTPTQPRPARLTDLLAAD